MKKLKLIIEATVPWHSYGPAGDKKAEANIKRWIKETLDNTAGYIPLYVEKDETGAVIEDATSKATYKIR